MKKATYFLFVSNSCSDVYFYALLKKKKKKKIHRYHRHYFFSKSGKIALDINLIFRCTEFSDMGTYTLCVAF